jgi:hypothetical protein
MDGGPRLIIEHADALMLDFCRNDASSKSGGYDDVALGGTKDPFHITRDDIVAINTTMRARSPHVVWESIVGTGQRRLGQQSSLPSPR